MQLNRLAFNQDWFEGLNSQTMESGCTVEQYRMLTHCFFQNGPNSRAVLLQLLLGHLDRVNFLIVDQLVENKRFEKLSRHHLGQTTLVQLQGRPYDNYGSARVVNTLTKEVLAETALLAFEHVTQGFQRSLVGTNHRPPSTTIVKERID